MFSTCLPTSLPTRCVSNENDLLRSTFIIHIHLTAGITPFVNKTVKFKLAPSDEDRWKSKNENDSVPPSPLSCRAFPAIPICLVLASGSNHHLLLNKTPSVYFFWGRKGRKMNYYKTSFDTPPYEWHRGKTQQLKDYKAVVGAKWFDNWETDHLSFVWLWDWSVQMSTRADSLLVRVRNSDAG